MNATLHEDRRIGFDAHWLDGLSQGVKTVLYNLLTEMGKLESGNSFYLYHKKARNFIDDRLEYGQNFNHRSLYTNSGEFNMLAGFPYVALRDKLDLFYSHYFCPLWLPCPSVVTVHDILYETMPEHFGPRLTTLMRIMVKRSVKVASHITTVSHFTRQQLIDLYGVPQEKISVIPNAVSGLFRPMGRLEYAGTLGSYGITGRYILAVGRIARIKNTTGLLRAFSHLLGQGEDMDLIIAGNSDSHFTDREFGNFYRGMGDLKKRVRFIGGLTTDKLIHLYNGATIFVLPSFGEGFGLPVLEAMSCGVPTLCSDKTSLPEVAGDAAVFFDPHNQDEFNRKLYDTVRDASLRDAMKNRGFEVVKRFDWGKSANLLLKVFDKVISGSKAAGT